MSEEQQTTRIGPPEGTKRITDTMWEIPQSYKEGMRVPARILASKKLLDEMDMQVYEQVSNVALLPGIQRAAFVMPDGHYGYGFPIGGVAAFDVNNGGVISPGGIGFDINCLGRRSKILTEDSVTEIGKFMRRKKKVATFSAGKMEFVKPRAFMSWLPKNRVLKVTTENGNNIIATEDHPFLTLKGMVPLGHLHSGLDVVTVDGEKRLFDKIDTIKEIRYDDFVFDFNIPKTHNFIANNFVVSNCGMRLVLTNLTIDQVKPHLKTLIDKLFKQIPAGVGGTGFVKLTKDQFKQVLAEGAHWAVPNGYGWDEDLERTELNGRADWAEVTKVSQKAIDRGYNQIGTLGSGNHYLEIQHVKKENIHDVKLAKKWGIFPDQVVVMFHTGSRGEGHQIATDYLRVFLDVMEKKYGIKIMDRELACAPFNSPEGQEYYKAMACAVNFSFANRQTIIQRLRDVFSDVFKQDAESLGMKQVFDIAHNRATLEKHEVDGEMKELLVHRKGATASYYPGRKEIPKLYREDGSPVIIGGSMETGSYLLVGADGSKETFCSTAHGSGRTMSRNQAKRMWRGDELQKDMEKRGIYVRTTSFSGLAEEAGGAYKDVDEVIEATHQANISRKVVRFLPIGNVKG